MKMNMILMKDNFGILSMCESMVKYANEGHLIFCMENIHKLSLNTFNS
jgi:hypothetical protein